MAEQFRWTARGMIVGALAAGVQAVFVYGVDVAQPLLRQAAIVAGLTAIMWVLIEVAVYLVTHVRREAADG